MIGQSEEAKQRQELLERIWRAEAEALARALEEGEPTAATLNVARQFLGDNGIDAESLKLPALQDSLGNLQAALEGALEDDDDDFPRAAPIPAKLEEE